jgi:uncharacterized phage infection (PIP) family protein YhgE
VSTFKVSVKHAGHFKNKVPTPVVKDGKAEVNLTPQGVAEEKLSSSFARPLPVTVGLSYKFNGQIVPGTAIRKDFKGIKGKPGTVQVTYTLTNVSSAAVRACFQGFNGVAQDQTVQVPAPILANLSVTVPKNVTSFTAPGSTLSPSSKGVTVGWTPFLFEPLGAMTQSFSLTMTTSSVSIPRTRFELFTLNPDSITGQAPATSAAALGTAEAEVSKGISAVQGALDSLQQRITGFQASRSSQGPGGGLGQVSLPEFSGHGISLPQLSLPSLTLPPLSLPSLTLPSIDQSQASVNAISAPGITLPSITLPTIPSPDFGTLQTELATLGNHLDTSAVKTEFTSLGALVTSLAGNALVASTTAKDVMTLADTVKTAVTDIATAVDAFVALLPAPVQNALLDLQQLNQIITNDLSAFSPAEQNEPAFLKLAEDLANVKSLTSSISSAFADLQQRAQTFDGSLHTLQDAVSTLSSKANALESTASDVATATQSLQTADARVDADVQTRVADAQAGINTLLDGLNAAAATAADNIKTGAANAQARVNGLEAKAADAQTSAGQAVENAKSTASQAIADATAAANQLQATASQAVAKAKATVSQDVATAAQQAQQSIQNSQAAAQANAAQATSEAQTILDRANSDYAYLLSLNEQAALYQLPEGTATGATVQNGSYLFLIQGS